MNSVKSLFKKSGWIWALLVISQPILLVVAYQSISRIQEVIDTTVVQQEAIPEAREIITRLVQIGEYRGSCVASALLGKDAQTFDSLCNERFETLNAVYVDLPVIVNGQTETFFDSISQLNKDKIIQLNRLYIDSKAILDPNSRTYQLGFEVYRFYPRMIELLGRARGMLTIAATIDTQPDVLIDVRGAIAELGDLFVSTMLLGTGDQSKYAALVEKITTQVDQLIAFSASDVMQIPQDQRSAVIYGYFEQTTELIRGLAQSAEGDASELEAELTERINLANDDLKLTLFLYLILQFLLLMAVRKSLLAVKALDNSVEREHASRVQLEATLEKQKEMFAVIGHELRTPVAAIEMLTHEASYSDVDKLNQIHDLSDNLLHVLDDLRVVIAPERAMESKKPELNDPVHVVKRALSPLESLLRERALSLKLETPDSGHSRFWFHNQPLRQSVTNLVKNAAIHSGGTQVVVSLELKPSGPSSVIAVLTVEDDGKGIPEHLRKSVFEAFGRGDTEADGSGLGLFIVRNMVQLMGGRLTYAQSALGGAAFTLSLPMEITEHEEQPDEDKSTEAEESLNGLRVLLAEDEVMLRMLTEKLLEKDGALVSSYENGRLALEAFTTGDFDILVTDLMMPQMNGHELTRAVRAQSKEVIIIAVTAAVLGAETEQFIREGADFVLPKPITKKSLTKALREVRQSRSADV